MGLFEGLPAAEQRNTAEQQNTAELDEPLTGYRLHRLEVWNWGTFDQKIWTLALDGKNGLLTGDIGSGKSTLVDAMTTLLLAPNRIAYNKAAGAENKERSLRTYVLGHYKSERNADTGSSKPVALRNQNEYSVILGVFKNQGFDEQITLAQVFFFRDMQGPPERFYIFAAGDLSIQVDFSAFGRDIAQLRKRLRAKAGVEIFDAFSNYAARFRQQFNVRGEQAWELFHQTVSMKSVGNLTEFVQAHMLEAPQVEQKINDLIAHFEDLTRAHALVVKAKHQLQLLVPLVEDCDRHEEQTAGLRLLRTCRESLKAYFSEIKLTLIDQRTQVIALELEKIDARRQRREEQRARESESVQQLKQAIAMQGGERLEKLDAEMRAEQNERGRRQERAKRYAGHMEKLGLSSSIDEIGFDEQRSFLPRMRDQSADRENQLENHLRELSVDFVSRREEHTTLSGEISSLKLRPSNIPAQQAQIRIRMCGELGLEVDSLPFAGELLQVRAAEGRWEGAIERVMQSFATSLLVAEANYAKVSAWVDRTNLDRRRLVYLRTRSFTTKPSLQPLHQESLVHKLEVRQGSAFSTWVQAELKERFDYACCATQDQFQSAYRALSLTGQRKDNAVRHIKDDRTRLDDRTGYVLGWSNEAKLAVLEQKREALEADVAEIGNQLFQAGGLKQMERVKLDAITALQEFVSYREIDWPGCDSLLQRLHEEKRRLEEASDTLATLREQLQESSQRLVAGEAALLKLAEDKGKEDNKREHMERLRLEATNLLATIDDVAREKLNEVRSAVGNAEGITLELCEQHERGLREELQSRMDAENKRQENLRERIVRAMSTFKNHYPLESGDFDASLAAEAEYRKFLEQLRFHDLPKFEDQFKKELNTNSIRRIAMFQANLASEADEIKERIKRINDSLVEIDYNRDRYIELMQQPTFRPEVRQFRDDLRACIDGSLTGSGDDHYTETKFEEVKKILDRLKGRQGSTDLDRRWRDTVTDVRQWFQFSASEKWREDDREHEHYSDSGGKSGGQKEKLAYTVLAASLAYQFKLDWFEGRSKSFRFVVIDEAFGRGSDDSAEYGLELFRKLNLQLLIVTPLQKTHIIEPYVSSVGFVENRSGKSSTMLNLSIEDYRRQKAERSH